MRHRAQMTRAEVAALLKRAGVELPPAPPKYRSKWTYYDGRTLHTRERDCPPGQCPICDNPEIRADREHWYQSRSEAQFAAKCDLDLKLGRIRAHRRSPAIVLVPGSRSERVTYRPDRDVWITSDPVGPPDRRYEVKGERGMISQQGLMRIKWYRSREVADGLPPLLVVRGDGSEVVVGQAARRLRYTGRNSLTGER